MQTREEEDAELCIKTGLKEMEAMENQLKQTIGRSRDKNAGEATVEFAERLSTILSKIREDLTKAKAGKPEDLFREAIRGIGRLQRPEFLLGNFAEALKGDKSPQEVVTRYKSLGLWDEEASFEVTSSADNPGHGGTRVPGDNPGNTKKAALADMSLLRWARNYLSRFKMAGIQVAVGAIKLVPRFVGIKPRIGLAGPFPTLSFELEVSGLSIHELFEAWREGAQP